MRFSLTGLIKAIALLPAVTMLCSAKRKVLVDGATILS